LWRGRGAAFWFGSFLGEGFKAKRVMGGEEDGDGGCLTGCAGLMYMRIYFR